MNCTCECHKDDCTCLEFLSAFVPFVIVAVWLLITLATWVDSNRLLTSVVRDEWYWLVDLSHRIY